LGKRKENVTVSEIHHVLCPMGFPAAGINAADGPALREGKTNVKNITK
jgi:hypothetical protein